MLKANFKISETGGTGVVQLQALINSTIGWANVGTPITLANGQKIIDDNTDIEIDTAVFDAGMSYLFRLTDVAGTPVSNMVSCQIPYTPAGNNSQTVRFAAVKADIGFKHSVDDSWTVMFELNQSSLSASPATALADFQAAIYFYQAGSHTRILDDEQDHTTRSSSYTATVGGYGAGVYCLTCTYSTLDGRHASVSKLVKVDANGNILLTEGAAGHVINYANSTDISVNAQGYQNGMPITVNWSMSDSNQQVTGLGNGQPQTLTLPAGNKLLFYEPVLDPAMTGDFNGKFAAYMQAEPAI